MCQHSDRAAIVRQRYVDGLWTALTERDEVGRRAALAVLSMLDYIFPPQTDQKLVVCSLPHVEQQEACAS